MAHRGSSAVAPENTLAAFELALEAGVDVLIGVDPVQGAETSLAAIREATRGKLCLWGGVNGFVTVETGTEEEVRRVVRAALRELGPEGLILSPVDNVKDPSERTWRNVEALVDEWQRLSGPAGRPAAQGEDGTKG